MQVKEFFNSVAAEWDAAEKHTAEEIRPLVDLCDIRKTDKVLDLGCGTGIITALLAERASEVVALDIADNMIDIAKAKYADSNLNVRFVCGDFYTADLPKFDYVVIFNAYPHFTDSAAFVRRLYEVLRDGGRFAVLHNIGRATLDEHHDNVRDISRSLLPVDEEKQLFAELFNIVRAEETQEKYILTGTKNEKSI